MNIDTAIIKMNFNEENIKSMIKEIISIDINDNAVLEFEDLTSIRKEDKYGRYRATIKIKFENIKESIQIDIATGDPITPKAIIYKYYTTINDKCIKLWAYNLETVLAEKLETILSRGEASSRTRDYYDIYLIYKMYWNKINQDHFKNAVDKTFKKREFNNNIEEVFDLIKESEILKIRWNAYSKKYKYAKNISYDEIMHSLNKILEILMPLKV